MKHVTLMMALVLGALTLSHGPSNAYGASDPKNFTIIAQFAGWNSTLPAGTFTACSPTGTSTCNPTITEFRGYSFIVTVKWKDVQHNFAIYTKGTLPGSVNTAQPCSPPGTNGCWAKSSTVTSTAQTASVSFAAQVPPDDFSGPGGYEYYCQFHPTTMHGKITVYKSPNIDGVGLVSIVDAATLAVAFDSTPANPATWNIAVDLDNDGRVTIVDAAILAFYFDQAI